MKTTLHLNKLFILLLFVSISAMGQYTGGLPNVAAFKTATASASEVGFEPEKAVDTLLTTWCSVTGAAPGWLQVDLGSFHYIHGFGMILSNATELPRAVTFQTSEDGVTWIDIRDISADTAGTYNYDIIGLDAIRYIRYYITSKDARASFTEVMAYGYLIDPPGNPLTLPATNIETTSFTANWTEKMRADGYRITVATDMDFNDRVTGYNNIDVGNVLSLDVSGLTPATTYYYRVNAYNLNGMSNASNVTEASTLKFAQTITFEALTEKIYGDADFELTATSSSGLPVSFLSSDEAIATISGTTLTIVGAGTAMITAIQNGDATYDTAAPVDQDLVVNVKELTLTGTVAENKPYDGTADAVISGAVLTGVVGTDDVILVDEDQGLFSQSEVGSDLAVTTSMSLTGNSSTNYSLTQPDGLTADIEAKELMVTAEDKSREACSPNPLFTVAYTGFAEGEDKSDLTEQAAATCEADQASAPGTYDIIASGGSAPNYTLTYLNGTFTITEDVTSPTLTVQAISIELDDTGNATISPADLVTSADDNCGVTDTTLSKYAFTTEDIGNVNVNVEVSDAAGNSTSAFATVTVTGSTGYDAFSKIDAKAYPNPTNGKLEVVINSPVDGLKVMDMTGKTILRRTNLTSLETLDLTGFSNGVYIIQLQSGVEMKHIKVIKK